MEHSMIYNLHKKPKDLEMKNIMQASLDMFNKMNYSRSERKRVEKEVKLVKLISERCGFLNHPSQLVFVVSKSQVRTCFDTNMFKCYSINVIYPGNSLNNSTE